MGGRSAEELLGCEGSADGGDVDERAELDGPAEVADDIDADEPCAGSSSSAENAEQLIGRASVEYSGTFGRNRRTAWD